MVINLEYTIAEWLSGILIFQTQLKKNAGDVTTKNGKGNKMKEKMIRAYMKTAEVFSELSHARRLHVGAIVVKDDRIVSIGYNGMPAGWDNNCEYEIYEEVSDDEPEVILKTRPEVLHAESNAISKLAKSSESGNGATIFITHAPCLDCAKLIYQSGINSVFYRSSYRSNDGIEFLKKSGVKIEQTKKLDS